MSKKTPPKVQDKDVQRAVDKIYDEINGLSKAVNKASTYDSRTEGEGKSGDTRIFYDTESTKYYIEGRTQGGWGKTRLYLKGDTLEYVTGGGAVDWSVDQGGSPVINTGNYTSYTNAEAVTAMGALGDSNALNHTRYSDSNAVSAMGSVGNSNDLNHVRYADSDATSAMGVKGDSNALNHDKYTNANSVSAMGTKGDSNALNHDKYTNANAVSAMGTKANSNSLNHDIYTHPTSDGNKHIPSGGSTGQYVKHNGSGTGQWADLPVVTGANTLADSSLPTTTGYAGVFKELSTQEIKMYSLKAGANITLDKNNAGGEQDSYLEISAAGTTVSNANWTGVSLSLANGGSGGSDASEARIAFGLGDSATKNVGTGSTNVAAGNHGHSYVTSAVAGNGISVSAATGAVTITNTSPDVDHFHWDGSDTGLNDVTGRASLGLGTAALSASGDFAASSHNHSAGNITSGTLAVARGGTGVTTIAEIKTALSLGNAAYADLGTGASDAAVGNHSHSSFGTTTFTADIKLADNLWINGYTDDTASRIRFHHNNSDAYQDWETGNYYIRYDTTTKYMMDSSGNFHADADVYAYSTSVGSDKKLKKNIKDIKYGLSDVLKLRGVDFDWKEKRDGKHDIGVIAQEVKEIIPEVVSEVPDFEDGTYLTVDYSKLVPVLIESIKELKEELDELKCR